MRSKKLLAAVAAASVLVLAGCSSDEPADDAADTSETSDQASPDEDAAGGPDLDGIPDVVAEVDGQEISRDEFVTAYEGSYQQAAQQSQASGEEVDEEALKQQTVDNLVNTTLLVQAAEARGLDATEADIDETLEELATSYGLGSSDELLTALEEQGSSEDEVRSQVATQVKVDALVADEAGDIKPTRAELREAYDAAVAQAEQAGGEAEIPPFADVRPQLAEQVRGQKQAAVGEGLVEQLREDAEITINL
ncbi:MAG: SurA N-terminal domain-containing protein [Nocardioides sp.]|nr:SurA N-terminal domain-containing protein [Nocardioides sp.]